MKEQETILKSYRKEIEVLSLTLDVPQYSYDDERRNFFPTYEDILLMTFNNKRENKEILKIINYWGSNAITIHVNLTDYLDDSYSTREECIEHLKDWFKGNCDIDNDKIETYIYKGYVYTIPEYGNNIKTFDFDNDKLIQNYIVFEED